ncbi:MAG: hypothetical protein M1829_002024 [Trizodia sp. TS-e1964]|nr:MAG: hypothetical protein M1829_002024 [Trizodia sp. TS-e1964]
MHRLTRHVRGESKKEPKKEDQVVSPPLCWGSDPPAQDTTNMTRAAVIQASREPSPPAHITERYGLTEIYSPAEPEVDVVFVHGLGGNPYDTWTYKNPEVFWPADLLPSVVKNARILTYGYDADVYTFMGGATKDRIHNHAETMLSRLAANRSVKQALTRPLIFVCHSLGGLVVKRALIQSESTKNIKQERLRSIYVSTYGILFLGTPHNGSGDVVKWASTLEYIGRTMLPSTVFSSSPQLLEALGAKSETLQSINRLFSPIASRFSIYFFHEGKPTDLKGTQIFVVDEDSAAPEMDGVDRLVIEASHSNMCKFKNKNSPGFFDVAEGIQRYAGEAEKQITKRWREEQRNRLEARKNLASDMFRR